MDRDLAPGAVRLEDANPVVSDVRRGVAAPIATTNNGSVGVPSPTLVGSPRMTPEAASAVTKDPIPDTGSFAATGATTLPEQNRTNVTHGDAMLQGRDDLPAETGPEGPPRKQLPSDDGEAVMRLRAYLEFARKPVEALSKDYAVLRAGSGRTIPDESQVTVRGRGGFDSPEVEIVARSIGTRAPGLDVSGGPRPWGEIEGIRQSIAADSSGLNTGARPQPLPDIEVAARPVNVESHGIETGSRPQAPSVGLPAADGEHAAGGGATGDHAAGGDAGREHAGTAEKGLEFSDKTGITDKTAAKSPDFDSALLARLGASSEGHISQGNGAERTFDVTVDKVLASVLERIQTADLERGRVRFEIETEQGQTVRVRLTLDHNIVSARIDAPNEQIRDLLAGHAWELNQRLETEGFIPTDIEFCLAGGREQAANHGARPGVHHSFGNGTVEDDMENFTMVETLACAFESWA